MLSANSIALGRLKQSDGEHAVLNRILLAVLNQPSSETESSLSARGVSAGSDMLPRNWALCEHDILIHVNMIASQVHVFSEGRLDALAAALDAADPILRLVESATGFLLDPIEMANLQPAKHTVIEISRVNEGDRILLAFPLEIQELDEFAVLMNSRSINLSNTLVSYSIILKSPQLTVDCIADLSIGDMVILGNGFVEATVTWQDEHEMWFAVEGRYDFSRGQFMSAEGSTRSAISFAADDMTPSSLANAPAFSVRLKARVDGLEATAGRLAGIQSGAPLDIGKLVHGINVALILGEKEILSGELVQICDHFAVLVNNKEYNLSIVDEKSEFTGVAA